MGDEEECRAEAAEAAMAIFSSSESGSFCVNLGVGKGEVTPEVDASERPDSFGGAEEEIKELILTAETFRIVGWKEAEGADTWLGIALVVAP